MKLEFDINNPHIASVMKDVQFLDIETSLIDARVFRPGTQFVGAHQTSSTTRLLTVAGGTMYDLYTKGEEGMWSFGNHMSPSFSDNPLDDTFVLRRLWDILDHAKVVVAWNASFDVGHLNGRFLECGWPLPSKYSVVCPFRALKRYRLTSKKLDQMSKFLLDSAKIPTNFDLWDKCSNGDVDAFEEMMRYNRGDIHDTLYKLYIRIAPYIPDHAVDFVDYDLEYPQCKVNGDELEWLDATWTDRKNGRVYQLYYNESLGITYRDRYPESSPRSGRGFVRHHV